MDDWDTHFRVYLINIWCNHWSIDILCFTFIPSVIHIYCKEEKNDPKWLNTGNTVLYFFLHRAFVVRVETSESLKCLWFLWKSTVSCPSRKADEYKGSNRLGKAHVVSVQTKRDKQPRVTEWVKFTAWKKSKQKIQIHFRSSPDFSGETCPQKNWWNNAQTARPCGVQKITNLPYVKTLPAVKCLFISLCFIFFREIHQGITERSFWSFVEQRSKPRDHSIFL